MKRALEHFCKLLDRGDFFQAHESLEESWLYYKQRDIATALYLRGLINAAIAFEHLKRKKPNANLKAIKTFACYKRAFDAPQKSLFDPAVLQINAMAKEFGLL